MGDDLSPDTPLSPRQRGCVFGAALLPVFFVLAMLDQVDRAYALTLLLAVFCVSLYQTKDAMNENFYGGIVPPLFVAQVLGLLLIPLSRLQYAHAVLAPLAIGALVFNLGVIRLSQRMFNNRPRNGS